MNFPRRATLAVCGLLLTAVLLPTQARAAELDTSYISSDAITAIVLHPRKLLTSPELEMLPVEVVQAMLMENLGIDPLEIEEAIGFLSLTGLPMGTPGMGAILRFAKPYDRQVLMAKLGRDTKEATHAGKTYQETQVPDGFSFYMADERTLVVGTKYQLKNMLAAKNVDTQLVKLLKQADTSKSAVAVLDFNVIRPLVQLGLGSMGEVPAPFNEFVKLVELVQWVNVTLDIKDGIDLTVTLAGRDAAGAEQIKLLAERAKAVAKHYFEIQFAPQPGANPDAMEAAMGKYVRRVSGKLLDAIAVKVEQERVQISLLKGTPAIATTGVMVALTLPAVQAAREAARRNQSANNLKQIGLALLTYHDVKKQFPARAITGAEGKPLLSWRVAILPYLEQDALYKEFHLDEPWDSEHNRKLVGRMPTIYANPNVPGTDNTVYLAATGEGTVFGGNKAIALRDVIDGTSYTVAVVEADPDRAVPWTKPDDLNYNAEQPMAGLGNLRPGGFSVLFCDGSVRFIANSLDPTMLKALFTYRGGEIVQLPE